MKSVDISGNGFRYRACVGHQLIERAGELTREVLPGKKCAVIADENSSRFFAERLRGSLNAAGINASLLPVAAGEQSKSLTKVEEICGQMVAMGLDRGSFVVGLGGGVIGDISGFAAAIFHRGIPHVQIPTTLLAMVDSAIGGKTGVNLSAGKNLVGCMHQPSLVIADVDALARLPPLQLRQGYAEIIKHAIIRDAEMFRSLQVERANDWVPLICRNIAIKREIVAVDDRERTGDRALLNFGHTVGHGIEQSANFKLPHGDCVSLGMIAACAISIRRAGLSQEERDQIVALLRRFDLPTRLPPEVDRARIAEAIARDKKFEAGQIRFVVTPKIGDAHLCGEVTMADIREAIAQL